MEEPFHARFFVLLSRGAAPAALMTLFPVRDCVPWPSPRGEGWKKHRTPTGRRCFCVLCTQCFSFFARVLLLFRCGDCLPGEVLRLVRAAAPELFRHRCPAGGIAVALAAQVLGRLWAHGVGRVRAGRPRCSRRRTARRRGRGTPCGWRGAGPQAFRRRTCPPSRGASAGS